MTAIAFEAAAQSGVKSTIGMEQSEQNGVVILMKYIGDLIGNFSYNTTSLHSIYWIKCPL